MTYPSVSNSCEERLVGLTVRFAEAVRHIHNIGPSGLGPGSVAQNRLVFNQPIGLQSIIDMELNRLIINHQY